MGALYFFKNYNHNYPLLTELALSILCITCTSVPSESLFSRAGNVENDLRNRLNHYMLEKLMIFKENVSLSNVKKLRYFPQFKLKTNFMMAL